MKATAAPVAVRRERPPARPPPPSPTDRSSTRARLYSTSLRTAARVALVHGYQEETRRERPAGRNSIQTQAPQGGRTRSRGRLDPGARGEQRDPPEKHQDASGGAAPRVGAEGRGGLQEVLEVGTTQRGSEMKRHPQREHLDFV